MPDLRGETTMVDDHTHDYIVNDQGNGNTMPVRSHVHRIKEYVIELANRHIHEINQSIIQIRNMKKKGQR